MRVAIVNDMKMTVELLRRVISGLSDFEVAWTADDGRKAVEKCLADPPDLMIMDIIMPVMDGVEATRRIMDQSPCAILIVTATVDGCSSRVFEALGEGALDAVNTPDGRGEANDREFIRKVMMLKKLLGNDRSFNGKIKHRPPPPPPQPEAPLVAIGSSTGGPKALADFFSVIPADLNAAFVIIQHIDERFAPGLASWLNSSSSLQVKIAVPGDRPRKGGILLAGTNDHMIMRPDGGVEYTPQPLQNPFRPSVDVFFHSLAEQWKNPGMGVLMTGIGRDGAEGLLHLKKSGWTTFAQNQQSCVVYGMPRAAVELKAADEVMPPMEIARCIAKLLRHPQPR